MNRFLALALYLFSAVAAFADGYPFKMDPPEVTLNHIRLKLTAGQELEVATWGRVTLDKQQLILLRPHIPKIPPLLRVIATTFNDNLEYDPNPVCLWTTPNEIAVTFSGEGEEGEASLHSGEGSEHESNLRISPKGQLFHLGKEITRDQALDLIANAKKAEGVPDTERFFTITKAPAYRPDFEELIDWNKKAEELFNAFVQHGTRHGVTVHGMW
jgi:hypothetical protein